MLNSRLWEICLSFYLFSVVYGRIYAGMHSIMGISFPVYYRPTTSQAHSRFLHTADCVAGSALGAAISWAQWRYFDAIESFMLIEGWMGEPDGLFRARLSTTLSSSQAAYDASPLRLQSLRW